MTGVDWLREGIHPDVAFMDYLADPCKEPSLTAGVAHKLISRSPLHAKADHPRLNPGYVEKAAGNLDFGTAAHAALLQGEDICAEVDGFDDWRKQAARDRRDEIRQLGLIPLLSKDFDRLRTFVRVVQEQLATLDVTPGPFCDGKAEQTLVWQEDGTWCRGRIDWLHTDRRYIDDLKTVGTTANPYEWARRRLFTDGYDLQAAWYLRGHKHLTGQTADWRFVVCETEEPYAVSVISLAPSALELANTKCDRALKLWRGCLETGRWPGYPTQVSYAELPAWVEAAYLEKHWEPEEVAA